MKGVIPLEAAFGSLIRECRTTRQLSISQLAARAGVAKGTISGWEALPLLPGDDAVLPSTVDLVPLLLQRAEILRALGETAAAEEQFTWASAIIAADGLPHLRARADRLARQMAGGEGCRV